MIITDNYPSQLGREKKHREYPLSQHLVSSALFQSNY